jgi:HEPN domain-containing protein
LTLFTTFSKKPINFSAVSIKDFREQLIHIEDAYITSRYEIIEYNSEDIKRKWYKGTTGLLVQVIERK